MYCLGGNTSCVFCKVRMLCPSVFEVVYVVCGV